MERGRVVIETERLILRTHTPADVDALAPIFADPEVTRYIGDGSPRSREMVAERVARAMEQQRSRGFAFWVAVRKDTGEVIGDCGLTLLRRSGVAEPGPEVEVGYRLARAHWGMGFATEGARAALAHGLGALGLGRIVAVTDPANAASRRVLAKIGMREVGLTDAYYDTTTVLFEAAPA